MNKIKKLWSNSSFLFLRSAIFIIIGIVLVSFALFGIWAEFDYTNKKFPIGYPNEGDYFGILTIPVLDEKLPMFQGTGTAELRKGVGHVISSALPGEENNCVISGHRETSFAGIGKLNIGDKIIIQTVDGTFTYEVSSTRIVDKDDDTVIVPTDNATLTMTTCYPFSYLSSAEERYIVSANLVKDDLSNK